MALSAKVRVYNCSDADLIQIADTIKNCMSRDRSEFQTRAVDLTRVATFASLRDAFSDLPTDEELQGGVTTATEAKNASRKALEAGIRVIRNMAELQFGSSGIYSAFSFEGLTTQPDNDLVRTGRRISRMTTRLFSEFVQQGFNQSQKDDLSAKTTDFDNKIDDLGAAIEERDIQTQARIMAGNALYQETIKLASIGKSLFEDRDEARYNDYVIFSAPEAPAVPTPSGNVAG